MVRRLCGVSSWSDSLAPGLERGAFSRPWAPGAAVVLGAVQLLALGRCVAELKQRDRLARGLPRREQPALLKLAGPNGPCVFACDQM